MKILITALSMVHVLSCGEREEKNKVNINQINRDNSNNYRYIFRKEIEKERKMKKLEKEREDPFKD